VQVPAKRQLGGRAHRPPVFGLVNSYWPLFLSLGVP